MPEGVNQWKVEDCLYYLKESRRLLGLTEGKLKLVCIAWSEI